MFRLEVLKMKDSLLAALVAACFIVLTVPDLAEAEIDKKRMRRDLSIMEDVLKSLYRHANTSIWGTSEPRVRGMYFENYGVIFFIEERVPEGTVGIASYLGLHGFTREQLVVFERDMKKGTGSDIVGAVRAQQEKRRTVIENQLREFLGIYADAIHQLKGEDRIAVLVHFQSIESSGIAIPLADSLVGVELGFGDTVKVALIKMPAAADSTKVRVGYKRRFRWKWLEKNMPLPEETYFEMSATKRDIVEYRSEQINEEEFRKRLAARDHKPNSSQMKKLGIMAAILEEALKPSGHLLQSLERETLFIYLEGLGAFFFLDEGDEYWDWLHLPHTTAAKPGAAEKQDRERFKEELIEVVGDYGYTLRTSRAGRVHSGRCPFSGRVGKRPGARAEGSEEGRRCIQPGGNGLRGVSSKGRDPGILIAPGCSRARNPHPASSEIPNFAPHSTIWRQVSSSTSIPCVRSCVTIASISPGIRMSSKPSAGGDDLTWATNFSDSSKNSSRGRNCSTSMTMSSTPFLSLLSFPMYPEPVRMPAISSSATLSAYPL